MDIAILVYPGMTALDAIGPYEVLISKAETRIAETARSEMSKRSSNIRNLISVPALLANQWFARLKHR
jgi:putative intracellular protease/amidase